MLLLQSMRTVQNPTSPDVVILYLVGSHLDDALRAAIGPGPGIYATADASPAVTPCDAVTGVSGPLRTVTLVGYSAGCQGVRSALRTGAIPVAERLGVVAIDGTHANWPPLPWQVDVWRNAAERAINGRNLFVATCTSQTYTETLPKGQAFASTLSVVRAFTPEPVEIPGEYHAGNSHVHTYLSKVIDKAAHIAQMRDVLPWALKTYVRPWIDAVPATAPATCPT